MIGKRAVTGRVRWALAVAAATGAALLLSACAAGKQAQTVQETPVNDANDANFGPIALRAVAVKPPSGNSYAKGSSAQLQMVLVNQGTKPDTLTSITSPAFSGWSSLPMTSSASASPLALASSSSSTAGTLPGSAGGSQQVKLLPNRPVSYGVPVATHILQVTGIKQVLWPGSAIRVTFTFQRAGSKTVIVPIQLTSTPGTQAVGGETSSPPGGGAASEPVSEEPSSSLVPASSPS